MIAKNVNYVGFKLHSKPKTYGKDKEGRSHRSRHHVLVKRFKQLFKKEDKSNLEIDPTNEIICLCYECHEEVIHNIVITRDMIKNMSQSFQKCVENYKSGNEIKIAKIKKMNEIIKNGIEHL